MGKTKQGKYGIFFIGILLLLAICGICIFMVPERTFSENENRYLTTFQPVTVSGILDGTVQENLTEGASDQFPGRDFWMQLSVQMQKCIGKKDIGGVYLGKDGYFFEKKLDLDISPARYENNLRYIDTFLSDSGAKGTLLLVPSAGIVLSDKLPRHAVLYDAQALYVIAQKQLQNITLLDIRDDLLKASGTQQIYFKTDHHWTTNGAYIGYEAYCKAQNRQAKAQELFQLSCVSTSFYGTLQAKAPGFGILPDELWLPQELPDREVLIDGAGQDGIYVVEKLDTKDKYAVYFGGNFGRIDIRAKQLPESDHEGDAQKQDTGNRKLLIIKDSFANSLVPYLMADYDEIVMLDLRYFNDSVAELVTEEKPDEILVLYELDNFAQDMNLFKVLK